MAPATVQKDPEGGDRCLPASEQKDATTITRNFSSFKLTFKHNVCRDAVVYIWELWYASPWSFPRNTQDNELQSTKNDLRDLGDGTGRDTGHRGTWWMTPLDSNMKINVWGTYRKGGDFVNSNKQKKNWGWTYRLEKHQIITMCWNCVCAKSPQSCLTVCDHVDCSPAGCSVHGNLQARTLEWVATPLSREASRPGDRTRSSGISWFAGGFSIHWATWVLCVFAIFCVKSNQKNKNRQIL